jgi:alpha-D-xyloside xylohydrolase
MRLTLHRTLIALTSALAFVPAAFAAPLTTLDRNGAWVSV